MLAGTVVGCGGGEGTLPDTSRVSGATSPRAAADRICAAAERRIAAQVKRRFPDLNVADGVPLDRPEVVALEIVAPAYRQMLRRLRALEPSPRPAGRYRILLRRIGAGVDQLAADPEVVAKPQTPAMRRARRLALALGFHRCAI